MAVADTLSEPRDIEAAIQARGRELLAVVPMQFARRNLNRQPTIKVPAGYKFTVRVNRDIIFNAPYMPIEADPQALPRTTRTTAQARK